jgi:peroxiredoxin
MKLKYIILFLLITNFAMAQQKPKNVNEAKGLAVGEKAYLFTATDQKDQTYDLKKTLKNGPVVVIFYRGQWCPLCNRHLMALQKDLQKITKKGATIVAVSPEKSEFLKKTASKTGAEFTLVYDEDYKISKAFDVAFLSEKEMLDAYNKRLNADLTNAHSDDSQQLPIPATFIINKKGKIIWRHVDPDYKKRASVDDIVNALNQQ